jgi:hypothetical protein
MLVNITGVLKDVVTELRNFKEAQQVSTNTQVSGRQPRSFNEQHTHTANFSGMQNHSRQPLYSEQYRQEVPINYNEGSFYRPSQSRSILDGQNRNYNHHDRLPEVYGQQYGSSEMYNGSNRGAYLNPTIQSQWQRPRNNENMRIPSFCGKDDWAVWIARFEAIARRLNWDDEDKLDQLLPRIEGKAAEFMFSQLQPHVLYNYRELVREMNNRFMVIETNRAFASKFSRRCQKVGETVEDFAADLKMLYDKAHGYRDRHIRDEDLVRRFLDGLRDDEARFEVEYHKEPTTIDEAVFYAVNFIQTRASIGHDRKLSKFTRRAIEDDK